MKLIDLIVRLRFLSESQDGINGDTEIFIESTNGEYPPTEINDVAIYKGLNKNSKAGKKIVLEN